MKLLHALVILMSLVASSASAQSFQLALRAFIPNEHPTNPGYVRDVPEQVPEPETYFPSTMIPGPGIPYLTNGPIPWLGSCYNTNDRGFTSAKKARSKVSSMMTFTYERGQLKDFHADHPPGKTFRLNCATGKAECEKEVATAEVAEMPALLGSTINISVSAKGVNPCLELPLGIENVLPDWSKPAVSWNGTFTIDTQAKKVRFIGTIGDFPSYEAYLIVNGITFSIFEESPAPTSTVWSLFQTRTIDVTVPYEVEEDAPETPAPTPTNPAAPVFGRWVGAYGSVNSTIEFRSGGVAVKTNYAGSETWSYSVSGGKLTMRSPTGQTTLRSDVSTSILRLNRISGLQPGPTYVFTRP